MFEITVETKKFNDEIVKPNFINPECFGEDFIGWLRERLVSRPDFDFQVSEPIQEDYGWGIWVRRGKDAYWLYLGCVGPAEWRIAFDHDAGLNIVRRLFHKPDPQAQAQLSKALMEILASDADIRLLPDD
jgi:hypothetical protein